MSKEAFTIWYTVIMKIFIKISMHYAYYVMEHDRQNVFLHWCMNWFLLRRHITPWNKKDFSKQITMHFLIILKARLSLPKQAGIWLTSIHCINKAYLCLGAGSNVWQYYKKFMAALRDKRESDTAQATQVHHLSSLFIFFILMHFPTPTLKC